MSGTLLVRVAQPHTIYKEQDVDGLVPYDIHLTGYDPVDGQVIRTPEGETLTPVYEVPRTNGVLRAIGEKRLIDVRDQSEVDRIAAAVTDARNARKRGAANASAPTTIGVPTPPATDTTPPADAGKAK